MAHVEIDGLRLECVRLAAARPAPGAPAIVLLHEGLGSVSAWHEFPQRVADATGCEAIAYSRQGYGESTPLAGPRGPRYLHDEALVVLPRLLAALRVERPVLVGHSDGASIALIHAGSEGARVAGVAGVVAMAPHVFVEDVALAGIEAAAIAYRASGLRERLARHHRDVDGAFRGWHDAWLAPAFRDWNVEEFLPRIACPVLAIQGEDDEYGTMEQLERVRRGARDVELLALERCGHAPHRDRAGDVLAAIGRFVARLACAPR